MTEKTIGYSIKLKYVECPYFYAEMKGDQQFMRNEKGGWWKKFCKFGESDFIFTDSLLDIVADTSEYLVEA